MVAVCKEWKLPVDFFKPKCTNEMHPEEGLASCDVCVQPKFLVGPTLCFGCPSTDIFPAIWNMVSPFAITGTPSVPFSGTYTFSDNGSNHRTADGADATITYTSHYYNPTTLGPKQLIAGRTSGTPSCGWGYSEMEYKGWMYRPTIGSPLSPSPAPPQCSFVAGYLEDRFTYSHAGATFTANGSVSHGNPCRAALPGWVWSGITEIPALNGYSLLDGTAPTTAVVDPCFGAGNFKAVQHNKCWSWLFRPTLPTGTATLTLAVQNYIIYKSDKVILNSDVSSKWRNAGSFSTDNQDPFVYPPAPNVPVNGEVNWTATYPCGNPSTLTLSYASKSGVFSNYTVPSTVVLRRA